eukprot:TRINITY_DN776237_c0_g1_i1.p1 TRINITY_DN776237_c0_g1~~TRINITY_DN776237_c0_g1_i1.p1  ORF type:complete len:113 (-),score=36.96 TRINITY_DN776237_c0_g1_i1:181-519(-)
MSVKQLTIKFNVCKRLDRELAMYVRELSDEEAKLQTMEDENKYSSQQRKVVEESRVMIPNCEQRLEDAIEKLKVQIAESEDETKESEVFAEAEAYLRSKEPETKEGEEAEDY